MSHDDEQGSWMAAPSSLCYCCPPRLRYLSHGRLPAVAASNEKLSRNSSIYTGTCFVIVLHQHHLMKNHDCVAAMRRR